MMSAIIPGIKKRPRWIWLTGALFLFVVLAVMAWSLNLEKEGADPLTTAERAWLKAHPVIRLAPDPDFPPVDYFDGNGVYKGITADYVALMEKKLGIRIEIVRLRNWDEIISKAKSRQIDAYVATKTPQRTEYLLFSRPFLEFPVVIIAREKVKGPLTLEKLAGMKVSVVSEYAAHNFIAYNHPKLNLDLVPGVATGLRKVSFGLSDAFVENLATATYYIEKEGITNLRIAGESGYFYRMGFCSRKDWPELNRILDKGLAVISADEKKAIYKKWIPVEPGSLFTSRGFQAGLLAAVAAILLMVAGVIVWNRALARQVRLRTGELENELAERGRVEEELHHAREDLEKRVEERTRELAETVQALRLTQFAVDRSLDQAFWMTNDGYFFYVNDAACHALGYTRDELVTMSVPDINPTCPPEMLVHYWQVLRENGADSFETCHRTKDGRVYPVEIRSNLLIFDGKEYNCCFVTDITERKRAEEALRESEARQKMAMDLAKLVQWGYDVKTGMFTFDDQFYALYGTTAEREGGTYMSGGDYARKFIPPEESALVAGGIAEVLEKSSNQLEHRIIRSDGEERVIVVRAEAVRDQMGYIVKIRGANQDITERKKMEEELLLSQFCIDKAGIGIYQSDENGTIFNVNDHACKSLGYSREEFCALSVFDIDPAITPEKMLKLKEVLVEKGSVTHETTHRRRDGTTFPVEITANILDYRGKTYGISFVKDITQRKQAEEALKESETRVKRKLENILDPGGDTGELDLADILDAPEIQNLMNDLYRITGLKMSIIDLKGRVLVGVGWQDICSKFHRMHPEARIRCNESDTDFTVGIPQGEFKTYRCRNNMWHLVTPIIVGGRHMGNLFMGQFFFADEETDYELFRAQARKYGFPEEEYIAALEALPRHSEELVNLGKAVFLGLTDMFSKLSYANIKLAHSLAERDLLTATLREASLVVENSPAVLFRWKGDDEWPVELVSGNIIQFGYTPDEFLSGSITYSRIIHPDDLQRVSREVHDFCDEGADQFRLEYRIMTKGGDVRWVNEHTHVELDASGCVKDFEGIVIDVTERKLAEDAIHESRAKYQAIVDSFDGLIYSCSQDYRIEFMNRKLIERTGRDAAGEYCFKVLHERDSVCPWCVNGRVLAGETVHWEILSPKDDRWYHVVNVPIYNANGTVSKHSVISDIHHLKLSEEKLREQKQQLEELNATLEKRVQQGVSENREKDIMLIQQNRQAALGEMLDHIAHQWKQPLTSISLIVQELEETSSYGELDDKIVEEAVGKTIALVQHMGQTIDTFRGFYRPDKEKLVFNLKDSIDQALAFMAPAFRFHSIAIELDVDPGLTAFGYPKEYAQVLLNILANARDIFMARGTERARVILRAFAEGNKAVVTIDDNGGGIPEAIIDRIFDFYFTTNEADGGTGIGLYMSRNIIEKNMGGTLTAVNTDVGALFRIEVSPT